MAKKALIFKRSASMIEARYASPSVPDEQGLVPILDRIAEELSLGGRDAVEAMQGGRLLRA
jgi:hypothetical protein